MALPKLEMTMFDTSNEALIRRQEQKLSSIDGFAKQSDLTDQEGQTK